jgi:thiol-disulfide isomerase/thioredoxin
VNRSRWTVLVLVAGALVLSLAYGLKGSEHKAPTSGAIRALQAAAALEPCPAGLGPGLPRVSLPCLGGGPYVDVSKARLGRPALVNVYGSWCHPCLKEMPLLRQFDEQAAGKVALVGVDTSDEFSKGLQFARDVRQHWPSVYDNNRVIGARFLAALPGTLFLDASGKVVYVFHDVFTSVTQIKDLVRQHLGVTV